MKKLLLAAHCLLLAASPLMAEENMLPPVSNGLDWSVHRTWDLKIEPLDFVQSLDNKKVFVLGADSKVYVYTSDGTQLGSIPVDKNTTAIDISPRGETLYLVNKTDKTYTAIDISVPQDIDTSGAPFLGNENAPVTLVLFSDFQCPYCSRVQPLLEQLLEQNPETVKIVFKHLPLPMHKEAKPAALAAIAAQNQGKFWQMHDALFSTSKALSKKNIETAAASIGLDMEQFKKDLAAPATTQKLHKDIADAQKSDVGGTPTLFINGHRVKNRSLPAMQAIIDHELQTEGK